MSTQQRYIYPPVTVQGLQALYSNPIVEDGYSTVNQQATLYNIKYDRIVTDKIYLPYNYSEIKLSPNELCTSISIFNIIDRLNYNFIYLNTRATLASNKLPTYYRGYYSSESDFSKLPYFYSNQTTTTATSGGELPVLGVVDGILTADPQAPLISSVDNGEELNDLNTGAWIRDNSLIDTTSVSTSGEVFHYGFLGSKKHMTVVKMSGTPEDKTIEYDGNGNISGSRGWVVLNKFSFIQDIPTDLNRLEYTNISKIKTDNKKNIYVLDRGAEATGMGGSSARRSMLYVYDVKGYIDIDNDRSIQKNKRILKHIIGDTNTSTNASDVIDPVAFTIDKDNNIIIYDDYDYTFKIFDSNINFLTKYSKRSSFFIGAKGTKKKYLGVSDIHYDTGDDNLYVLTPEGYIFIYDSNYSLKRKIIIPKETSNQSQDLTELDLTQRYFKSPYVGQPKNEIFKQLEFSKNENNVFYILTNNRLIKRFKTRPELTVGGYDFLANNIGVLTQIGTLVSYRCDLKFLSILQDAKIVTKKLVNSENEVVQVIDTDRTYLYDQMYMYTGFTDVKNSSLDKVNIEHNYILSFQEKVNTRSNMIVDDYTIYDISDTTSISHKEYASDIVYNKLIHKLLSNHLKMIENISYKLVGRYTPSGQLVFDKREYIQEELYRELIYTLNNDYFVGINEYLSTGVVNRVINKIIKIQKQISKVISMYESNKWPSVDSDVQIEPYLHTPGGEFTDINDLDYIGYYYISEQVDGDVYISGRNDIDGDIDSETNNPSTNRYLTPITG